MQHNNNNSNSTIDSNCSKIAPAQSNQPQLKSTILPSAATNPRFTLTPDNMAMNTKTDTPISGRQQQQHAPPLVDVRSYYERHNMHQSLRTSMGYTVESNTTSFQNANSNVPTSSYTSVNTDSVSAQRVSRNNISAPTVATTSFRTATQQQWNFDGNITKTTSPERQTNVYTTSALFCPSQSSTVQCAPTNCTDNGAISSTSNSTSHTLKSAGSPPRTPTQRECISHSVSSNVPVESESSVSHYEQQLQKFISESMSDSGFMGDSAKINFNKLNEIFSKRLQDIDENVSGDKDLKLVTYREWVEILSKINESFITNMNELEREVAERLELMQKKVNTNCRHSQGNELMKCRKDIDTLLKIIQNAYRYNTWDIHGNTFETISPAQVWGLTEFENLNIEGNAGSEIKNCQDPEATQRNKLLANMKALAHEVAEKHDEVRELKRQVICLEDEIQKAQKKIQLKDDVIKELRNDLKCANHKLTANNPPDINSSMTPINFETETTRPANTQISDCNTLTHQDENSSQFDFLSQTEQEEQQKLKVLEEELKEFFEMNKQLNKQKMDEQRKRLTDLFQKVEAEKATAYRKLDFIRCQLIDMESSIAEGNADGDSGFYSKSHENDHDAQILNAVRKRLRKLNEINSELNKRIQKLELKISELSSNLQSERTFSQRNRETLKQIADLLESMLGKQFSYVDIYNSNRSQSNPFCEAISEMLKNFQKREAQLRNDVDLKSKKFEDLLQSLLKNEEDRISHVNLNDFEDSTTISTLTTTTVTTPTTPTPTEVASPALLSTTIVSLTLADTTASLPGATEK